MGGVLAQRDRQHQGFECRRERQQRRRPRRGDEPELIRRRQRRDRQQRQPAGEVVVRVGGAAAGRLQRDHGDHRRACEQQRVRGGRVPVVHLTAADEQQHQQPDVQPEQHAQHVCGARQPAFELEDAPREHQLQRHGERRHRPLAGRPVLGERGDARHQRGVSAEQQQEEAEAGEVARVAEVEQVAVGEVGGGHQRRHQRQQREHGNPEPRALVALARQRLAAFEPQQQRFGRLPVQPQVAGARHRPALRQLEFALPGAAGVGRRRMRQRVPGRRARGVEQHRIEPARPGDDEPPALAGRHCALGAAQPQPVLAATPAQRHARQSAGLGECARVHRRGQRWAIQPGRCTQQLGVERARGRRPGDERQPCDHCDSPRPAHDPAPVVRPAPAVRARGTPPRRRPADHPWAAALRQYAESIPCSAAGPQAAQRFCPRAGSPSP